MTRKAFVPTPEHRKQVETLAAYGIDPQNIARLIINPATGRHITRDTLENNFSYELATGETKAIAQVASRMLKAAMDGNVTAMIFWLKARAGWRDTITANINMQTLDLTKLTDEQLTTLESIVRVTANQQSSGPGLDPIRAPSTRH